MWFPLRSPPTKTTKNRTVHFERKHRSSPNTSLDLLEDTRNHHCLGVIFGEAKPSDISGSFFLLVDRGDDDTVDGSEIR